jgi:signal transduction histidine kinase
LTILKGDVEVALNRPRSAEQYRETLELVNQTTDRLTTLVHELFLLAGADNNQLPLDIAELDLTELLAREVDGLAPQARKNGITLDLNTPGELLIQGDAAKLSRLFMNLIDNAIKYSGAGDAVKVEADIRNGEACVSITDTGPGIPTNNLPHLFDRFYRVDAARSRQASQTTGSGAGLGLSIAQWLAQVHGGRIGVSSKLGHGTTFAVWLPLELTSEGKITSSNGSL